MSSAHTKKEMMTQAGLTHKHGAIQLWLQAGPDPVPFDSVITGKLSSYTAPAEGLQGKA